MQQSPTLMSDKPDGDSIARAIEELRAQFPGRVSTGLDVCHQHANTLTWIASQPPDAVVWPETGDEVATIVRVAARYRVPVIAFGAGTSLEGHVNAPLGGISIDLSRMNRIVAVNAGDLDATTEAGVTRDQLNAHLRDTGLYFSVDPGAGNATLGGMAATRASGTNTVRFGSMRDNVINVTAVMADGGMIKTGGRARKSAAGYDLTHLLVGSEGTLGIIVELTVRLQPRPETVLATVFACPSVEAAAKATIEAIQLGCTLSRIELLDAVMMHIAGEAGATGLASDGPALFVEVEGTPEAAREHMALFSEIAGRHGATQSATAGTAAARDHLWKVRHDCFWAVRNAWPGKACVVTDVCVPITRLAECLTETAAEAARLGLTAPVAGHVGDGNFHAIVVVDERNTDDVRRLETFLEDLATRAIAMDGTCTGEHGIGQGKVGYLARELGPAVGVMRLVKHALDPLNILNPGKIFAD